MHCSCTTNISIHADVGAGAGVGIVMMIYKSLFRNVWLISPSFLLLPLLTLVVPKTNAQQFNYEVEKRIRDNLNFFLGQPLANSAFVASFFNDNGFPHQLTAPDRDEYLKVAYSQSKPHVYYGSEQGLFIGYVCNRGIIIEALASIFWSSPCIQSHQHRVCSADISKIMDGIENQ